MVVGGFASVKKVKTTNELLRKLHSGKSPLVLIKNDDAVAVVQDIEDYKATLRTLEFFSKVARGERELREGKGIEHEKVFDDIDAMIASHQARNGKRKKT